MSNILRRTGSTPASPSNYYGLLTGDASPATQSASQFGEAPSGYGSMYDQLFAANPYRKQTYNQSGWQKFLSGLGFRTGYDDWLDQTSTQIAEYDAGIMSQIQQDQFNSPAAMAERERAAGMNPDLLGIGDVAQAAGPTEDANGMIPQQSNDAEQFAGIVSQVSSTVLNLIPTVMSFATQIKQLKGLRLENDMKELNFGSQAIDAANKFYLEGIQSEMYQRAFQNHDFSEILEAANNDSKYLSEMFFSDKRARYRFNAAYGRHSASLLAELSQYKTYDEFEKHRKELLSQRASRYFSDDDETMQSLLSSFLQPIEEYQQKMNDIRLKYSEKEGEVYGEGLNLQAMQIENQETYEAAIDPSQQAAAENAANRATQQEREIYQATNELFENMMNFLKQKDTWWSQLAMAFIGIARAQLLSGMHMSFGRHSHYQVDGDTGSMSETGGSNFGLSF